VFTLQGNMLVSPYSTCINAGYLYICEASHQV